MTKLKSKPNASKQDISEPAGTLTCPVCGGMMMLGFVELERAVDSSTYRCQRCDNTMTVGAPRDEALTAAESSPATESSPGKPAAALPDAAE